MQDALTMICIAYSSFVEKQLTAELFKNVTLTMTYEGSQIDISGRLIRVRHTFFEEPELELLIRSTEVL